jgi:hypothetical protein
MRNVLVAMGNSGQKQYRKIIERFLPHADGMLAETAAWADQRLQSCSDREKRRSPHLSSEEVAAYGHTKI